MSKEIPLTRGYVAIVDDEDFAELSKYKWQALVRPRGTVYATRSDYSGGKRKCIYMHRQILNAPVGKEIDHKDRNGLNNTRSNLRLATRAQNSQNVPKRQSVSGFRGVSAEIIERFHVSITVENQHYRIGTYKTAEEAAIAYDAAAIALHGEFASLNFPERYDGGIPRRRKDKIIFMRAAGIRLQAIGDIFGVTRERVRQLHARANGTVSASE